MQGQLFDSGSYEERPATHSEDMTARHQGTANRTPAQQKLQANRDRIVGTPSTRNSTFNEESMSAKVTDYGFPYRGAASALSKLSPHDLPTWRRHGRDIEMPLHGNGSVDEGGFGTGQSHVNPQRVSEIAKDPSVGDDPRFPGHEKPLVADVTFRRNGRDISAPVLHQGNHRTMAAIERGELFTPARYIDSAAMPAAVADARSDRAKYAGSRTNRDMLAFSRMKNNDPTRTTR